MYLAIDSIPLQYPPMAIDIAPVEPNEQTLADGSFAVTEMSGVSIACRFGNGQAVQAQINELMSLRGNYGMHMLTFEDSRCEQLVKMLVYMPPVLRTGMPPSTRMQFMYGEITMTFKQFNAAISLGHMSLRSATVTVGDDKMQLRMPAAGQIIRIDGYLDALGAGTTTIQVRNLSQTKDYLSTRGDFIAATATGLMENQVLAADLDYMKDDIIALDIDAASAGAARLVVQVWYKHFRP